MTNEGLQPGCNGVPLELLARDELGPAGRAIVLDHLGHCRTCQERLPVMLGLEQILDQRREQTHLSRPSRPALVAGILLAAVLGSFLVYLVRPIAPGLARFASSRPLAAFPLETRTTSLGRAPVKAFEAYARGDFQAAVEALSTYPADPDAQLCLGVSLYMLGQLEAALSQLDPLARGASSHRSSALWFSAQAHLRLDRVEPAREALRAVARESPYYSSARRLLRQLPPGNEK